MTKRRLNGEGSISKRKDGRWMARFYVTLPDGERKRRHIVLKDKNEVLRKMKEELAQAEKGITMAEGKRTVAEWIEYWLSEIDIDKVKDSTHTLHTRLLYKHVIPEIGDILLTELRPEHIRTMLKNWSKNGVGTRSQQIARNSFSACIQDAMKLEYVYRNVVRLVDIPKHETKPKEIWTVEEMHRFLKSVKDHMYYGVLLVLCTYGVRRGEAFGLRWQDIDFDKGLIHIRNALYFDGNEMKLGSLKTTASARDLPMTPEIKEMLYKNFIKRGMPTNDDFVFISSIGKPIDGRSFLKTFQWLSVKAGIKPISVHAIRHSVATALKESGVSPKDAQTILGHKSITTTLQVYTHTSEEERANAIEKLNERIKGKMPPL